MPYTSYQHDNMNYSEYTQEVKIMAKSQNFFFDKSDEIIDRRKSENELSRPVHLEEIKHYYSLAKRLLGLSQSIMNVIYLIP